MWLSFGDGVIEVVPSRYRRDELTVRSVTERDIEQLFPGAPVEEVRASRADTHHYLVQLRRGYVAEVIAKALREMA